MKNIKREKYLQKIRPFYTSNYIKAITGIRRCGKSVILQQIIEEIKNNGVDESHILIYNLEGESGEGITTRKALEKRLHKDIKDKDLYYIFIDEVQHIKKFEIAIASVRVTYNCSLFITGSNYKLLHGKLQSALTGRAKEFIIYPFSYQESVEFKKLNNIEINNRDFEDYLKWGGMPQRYLEVDESGIHDYYTNLVSSIIEKDVFGNHSKIDRESFNNVASYILAASGRQFSSPNVVNYVYGNLNKSAKENLIRNVTNYAKYLSESFLTIPCKSFNLNGKRILKGIKKYYCVSSGIKTSFTNTISFDPSFALEEIVFMELLTRGYEVYIGDFRNGEIDFVVLKNNAVCYIQVAYLLISKDTQEREFGVYDKIKLNGNKYVMSLDTIDMSHNGIKHLNIVDWLSGKVDLTLS